MDEKVLSEFVQNESLDDEVLFLKPEFEIGENIEDSTLNEYYDDEMNMDVDIETNINKDKVIKEEFDPSVYEDNEESLFDETNDENDKLDDQHICWQRKSDSEPCCISVHPKFPEIAHVAIGNCGDSCTIYDFDSNNQNVDNAELLVLGPFEETVSCCSFSYCGNYIALGCLDGNLLIYSKSRGSNVSNSTDPYVKLKKIEKMLTSIEWLNFSEDSHLLVASGEGGILIVYQLKNDELQIININYNSNIGQITTYTSSNSPKHNSSNKDNLFATNNPNLRNGSSRADLDLNNEKEYNIICGCNDNNLVIVTLNGYYKQTSITKINNNVYSNKPENPEDEVEEEVEENIISICTHNRLKLCSFGTVTGNVSFLNINKKSVVKHYNKIHTNSVESIIFSNCNATSNFNSSVNSELAISIGLDGLIIFYDVLNNCNKLNVINVSFGLTKIVAHPQKNVFVVSSVDGKIVILSPQKVLKQVKCHTSSILDLQLLNITGDYYAITVSEDNNIVICNELFD